VRRARLDERTQLIALAGELDLYSVDGFRSALEEALGDGARHLVIDASEVAFIDSVALGVLVTGSKRLRAEGGGLGLVATNPNVVRVFEITGLDRMLVIADSLPAALERLSASDTST
jgi:anti-sigma B factor antagonist